MKTLRAVGVSLILIVLAACTACSGPDKKVASSSSHRTIIPYTQFQGNVVEMVIDESDHRVVLRVHFSSDNGFVGPDHDARQAFLMGEATRLTTGKVVELGKGYSFRFTQGHPILTQSVTSGSYQEGAYDVLLLAKGAWIVQRMIYAKGDD